MGVHNLWELLAPVGRRVSVETLAGKKLAIDASIWMIQFMKAMRDEKGEMIRNAHLVGFFRRICKLLFLRVKPVFVFDGATPALKRRTVIARRRQRENAQTKIRKTAEKLLLNQLKAMRLKELQQNLQEQRQQNDLEPKMVSSKGRKDNKGKRVVDETIMANHASEEETVSDTTFRQEAVDEMLAASIAAEEDGSFFPEASTSGVHFEEDQDDDDDEEMILPAMHGNVDPAVLAALPPSLQLDLLAQMRERLMAENRQKYQKVKKAPSRFSELQIQSYLKTVAFRREIDAVQKSAAGKGIGGMQTSRIASEANREFIFSSSFTGDKQVLASGGEAKTDTQPTENPRVDVSSKAVNIVSITRSNQTEECSRDTAGTELPNDVETYLDERGRIRFSRARAMGIRMTRDLQRNLELMKEMELERVASDKHVNNELSNPSTDGPKILSSSISLHNTKEDNEAMLNASRSYENPTLQGVSSLQISFETNDEQKVGDDEDLFARLVAGESLMNFPADSSPTQKPSDLEDLSASDCEWEEGVIDESSNVLSRQTTHEIEPHLADDDMGDASGIEWEDGCEIISKDVSPHPTVCSESLSRVAVEEEDELQEAIRRSLVDLRGCEDINVSCENLKSGEAGPSDNLGGSSSICKEDSIVSKIQAKDIVESNKSNKMIDNRGKRKMSEDSDNIETQSTPHPVVNLVDLELPTGDVADTCLNSMHKTNNSRLHEEINEKLENCNQEKDVVIQGQLGDIKTSKLGSSVGTEGSSDRANSTSYTLSEDLPKIYPVDLPHRELETKVDDIKSNKFVSSMGTDGSSGKANSTPYTLSEDLPNLSPVDVPHRELETKVDDHRHESLISGNTSSVDVESERDYEPESFPGHSVFPLEKEKSAGDSSFNHTMAGQVPITEASLEEELLILDEESRELGNEQKRLERNAGSVSSEMFAECQELLQMFGLPYIIAPMEAEAQCAFMELANLVDGVVTDDSDAFLFGARSVYKNIFDDRKYVETYFMKDIENELGLDRDKLIRMALLLGSDYTEGISGIGIVNAIEVVNAFPEEDGLCKFREWIESPDPSIFGRLNAVEGSSSKKRGSKVREKEKNKPRSELEENSDCDINMSQSEDENNKLKQIFMEKHRNVSKNWHIPSTFPSDVVISAYASPQVDNSKESFSWGRPDLLALHKVCWEKFGWGSKKADEVLLPVLKEHDKHETQLRLEAFYTFNEKFAKIRSKRIKSALKGVRGNRSQNVMNDSGEGDCKSKKRRKSNHVEAEKTEVEKDSGLPEHGGIKEKIPKMSKQKQSNRRNGRGVAVTRPSEEASMRLDAGNGSKDTKGRGRRNLSSGKRNKNKMDSSLEDAGTSSDGKFSNETEERDPQEFERPLKVRRSERARKTVNYTISDDWGLDQPDEIEECCTTSSKLDDLITETSHDQVIGISSTGQPPYIENKSENLQQGTPEELESSGRFGTDATETSQVNFVGIGNAAVEDQLLEEYLKMGGGFCLEDAAHGNTGEYSGKAALAEDHISEEYLKTGGGFCSDDDEAANDNCNNRLSATTQPNSVATAEEEILRSNPSQTNSSHASGENEPCNGRSNVSVTENVSTINSSTENPGLSSSNDIADGEKDGTSEDTRPLRAMPNLRRKRRRT